MVATCVVLWLLFFVVDLPLFPNLYPEGAIPTGIAWYAHVVRATLPPLTLFLGGLISGVVAPGFRGLNGAVSAAVPALGAFAWFVGPLVPWTWEPIINPDEAYTRVENLGNLLEVSVVFCAVFSFVILAGYLGERLGGRLRTNLVNQIAS